MVMVAVGHVGPAEVVVDVEKVVMSWIGMRGLVRAKGRVLLGCEVLRIGFWIGGGKGYLRARRRIWKDNIVAVCRNQGCKSSVESVQPV